MPAQGRAFFDGSLRLQAHLLAAACSCTVACAEAYLARNDAASHERFMKQAKAAADLMATHLQAADARSGPLKDWYAPEKIFGLRETRDMIQRRLSGEVRPAAAR